MIILPRFIKCLLVIKWAWAMEHYFVQDSDHNIDIKPLPRSPTLTPNASEILKVGRRGAISSDLEFCNNLAIDSVLKKFENANAADAAVTVALCLGMINFFSSGIGGGGFAIYASGNKGPDTGSHLFLDFRERAPYLSHKNMFENSPNSSQVGGLAVGVPGELQGLYELFSLRGSGEASWADLLEPVAEVGLKGWPVNVILAATLKMYEPFFLEHADDWSFVLTDDKSRVLKEGETIRRLGLSKVLFELAQNGTAAPFYDPDHWIAQSMVAKIRDSGGIMTVEDLESYFVNVSDPLSTKIRSGWEHMPNNDLEVLTSSGSSSGAALISALDIMDHFSNYEGGDYLPEEAYKLVEAMKWMSSAKSRLGDYSDVGYLPERISHVLDYNWTKNAVDLIKSHLQDLKTLQNWTDYHPAYELTEPHGTTHFSVVDRFDNAVSLTSTINLLFGSLVHDPHTGVVFNNQMDDFSQPGRSNAFDLAPSVYNFAQPGKRPLSSAAPVVILNELGQPELVIGASGGSRITSGILQAIVRIYWYNMPLLEAIAYPRIHHQLLPDVVEVESFSMLGKATVSALRDMGHTLKEQPPKNVLNAIQRYRGEWHAVSDYWRKRGISGVF